MNSDRLPADCDLPFFAYGMFQPSEIAFFRIKAHVESTQHHKLSGSLLIRDGILVADKHGNGRFGGSILTFYPNQRQTAYEKIAELEPEEQYRWAEVAVSNCRANILWGRKPNQGSQPLDYAWSGWQDPMLTVALDVVEETLSNAHQYERDLANTFRLQMSYLLLWSAIERYTSLRYHLRGQATAKVLKLAEEPAFAKELLEQVKEDRKIHRTDTPDSKQYLKASDPLKSLGYYYQVRSNLVHRGKAMPSDHKIILLSCRELLAIFRSALRAAQKEATAEA